MTKNPSDTWFYNDWENDEKLKACSLAAQGLWMRLLCIAARSPERGIVQIGSLNLSLPDGLAHVALAVGRPLEEIAPLIDELVSSGAAYLDRRKQIYNKRMRDAAKVSAARAEAGEKGALVTNGQRWGKVKLPQQNVSKPPPSSSLPSPESLSHGDTPTVAARASASPDGPPRTRLPDSAKWAERLAGYRPWEGKYVWQPNWGLRPDSAGRNPLIPPALLAAWRSDQAAARQSAA